MSSASVSVVVGFKNWGAERLEVSARSIVRAFGSLDAELIISDYGSDDLAVAEDVARDVGATVCRTEGDPVWSRSRALNAGFSRARGQLLISTDADMVFSSSTIQTICRWWEHSPRSAYFLQCRDLSPDVTARLLDGANVESEEMERTSKLRPRWGMGGMMAISRAQFASMRGFDERLHTYGREDMDFALRARRAGYRNIWIESSEARMYHMWHEPALVSTAASDDIRHAVARNRRLVDEDETWVRNLGQWRHPLHDKNPLIRVVVLNSGSGELAEGTLTSLQAQSVTDWEALVVTGVASTSPEQWGRTFEDKRIRVLEIATESISEVVTASTLESSADFIMFLDSGCVIPPDFLKVQLSSFTEDVRAVHGRQVDLRKCCEPELGEDVKQESAQGLGVVFHGSFVRQIARHAGEKFLVSHLTTIIESLNRVVITNHESVFFRVAEAAGLTLAHGDSSTNGFEAYLPYLPDGYVNRVIVIDGNDLDLDAAEFEGALYDTRLERDGEQLRSSCKIVGATYRDMAWLRTNGFTFSAYADPEIQESAAGPSLAFLKDTIQSPRGSRSTQATAVVVMDGEALADLRPGLGTIVSEHKTGPEGECVTGAVVVFTESDLQEAFESLGERVKMVLYPDADGDRRAH